MEFLDLPDMISIQSTSVEELTEFSGTLAKELEKDPISDLKIDQILKVLERKLITREMVKNSSIGKILTQIEKSEKISSELKLQANEVKKQWMKQIEEQKDISTLPFICDEMKLKISEIDQNYKKTAEFVIKMVQK